MVMMMDDRKLQQRREALQRANMVRLPRAALHRDAKEGRVSVPELIEDPPAVILTAEIGTVVEWAPGVGRWRSKKILDGLTRAQAHVGNLSERTRDRIADRLRDTVHDEAAA